MSKHQDHIEELVARMSKSSPPQAPKNLEQNVWRRIRETTRDVPQWWPYFWPSWLSKPVFGIGLAAACIAIGMLFSSGFSAHTSKGLDSENNMLSVFSDNAPGMLKTD